ncbi:hypothetical protein PENFLA_c027G08822 [Penicillium flavigenum]|uniref:Major facilitator superfamily (MFS) profile domain-containing protein n=1 Tax=Penicillium flavigenum TaxID=254877 RepID=A0A1V6SST2_9EURO|nr:hypothetical protein PENFLA_c027G08822 [Penicillium flavigenum]
MYLDPSSAIFFLRWLCRRSTWSTEGDLHRRFYLRRRSRNRSRGRRSMFIVGRIVEGVGEGLFLGNLVVFICEISPTSTRGALTTGPQLAITLGLVMGYFISYGTSSLRSSLSWRMPFILLAAFSMVLCGLSLLYLPESPQWLGLHGRYAMAEEAWDKLGVSRAEREKVVLQVRTREVNSETEKVKDGTMDKLLAIFSKDVIGRTILAVFLMGMQQMSGIDGVLYYAPQLFQKAGLASSEASFLASGVSALVIFAVTIPGLIYADKWGRRSSIVYGGVVMGVLMFLMGGLYAGNAVHKTTGAGRWVVIVCIYIFSAIYSVTWGISVKVYSAEIQPQRTRASATTLAHSSNWVCNFLVALTTPVLLAKSSFGAYFLFGGCCVITVIVGVIFMHETKGRTFGEIEEAFKAQIKQRQLGRSQEPSAVFIAKELIPGFDSKSTPQMQESGAVSSTARSRG